MKRAIALHRANQQKTRDAAPKSAAKPTPTNIVDHWGGACPPLPCLNWEILQVAGGFTLKKNIFFGGGSMFKSQPPL